LRLSFFSLSSKPPISQSSLWRCTWVLCEVDSLRRDGPISGGVDSFPHHKKHSQFLGEILVPLWSSASFLIFVAPISGSPGSCPPRVAAPKFDSSSWSRPYRCPSPHVTSVCGQAGLSVPCYPLPVPLRAFTLPAPSPGRFLTVVKSRLKTPLVLVPGFLCPLRSFRCYPRSDFPRGHDAIHRPAPVETFHLFFSLRFFSSPSPFFVLPEGKLQVPNPAVMNRACGSDTSFTSYRTKFTILGVSPRWYKAVVDSPVRSSRPRPAGLEPLPTYFFAAAFTPPGTAACCST